MVRRESGSMTQKDTGEAFRRAGVRPRFALELGSREALCEAVGAGLGCGIIWDSEAQDSNRFLQVLHLGSKPDLQA
jgi:DNA-binding transcriptional LysR family regulator